MNLLSRKNALRLLLGATLAAPLATMAASPAGAATVSSSCTRYVAPTGAGDGATAATPMSFDSLVAYVNAGGRAGAVACLAGGSYGTAGSTYTFTKGGAVGSPVSIVKNPTATTDAVIAGRIVIGVGADNMVIGKLKFVGPGTGTASAYTVDANNVELIGNDISAPNRICISVGSGRRTTTKATGFVADGNRIHDCGTNLAKVGSPQAHGVYLEYSQGAIVRNNLISNPVGRGVQLFNDADGSLIENNIFDGNFAAVNFGGGTIGSSAVDPRPEDNIVQNNIVTNGVMWCNTIGECQKALAVQGNHEAAYAKPPSTDPLTKAGATWGNVVRSNCVYFPNASVAVTYNDWEPGFTYETTNKSVDPQYNNGSIGDFRLKTTSPCLGKGIRPAITSGAFTPAKTSVTASAILRSPLMTAGYRLQVRLCDTTVTTTTSTASCTGTWVAAPTASLAGTDATVSQTISGLLANRIYEARWVSWQALQAAPATTADLTSTVNYWTASAPAKFKTLA